MNRRSAFLDEMGIGPLWTLRDVPAIEPPAETRAVAIEEVAAPVTEAAAPPAPAAAPVPAGDAAWEDGPAVAATDTDIAAMGWQQLRAAVAGCTRCGLCKNGAKPVFGAGAQSARWLVAAGATSVADENERQPVSGEPGKLLANMLAAVGRSRAADVYVTNLIKCRPTGANGGDRAPSAAEAAACRPYLERELALSGAGMVLTLGQIAANGLLDKELAEPLSGSRGTLHDFKGVPMVATLHPGELLRRGADKALAWADLCMAASADVPRD